MPTRSHWIFQVFSLVAIGAACWLLSAALRDSWREMVAMLGDRALIGPLTALSVAHSVALGIAALAWRYLVGVVVGAPVSVWVGLRIYAISNVAKYLPGNVFHFAGRQLMGGRAGWPQHAIARATLLELGLNAGCALALIALTGATVLPDRLSKSAGATAVAIGHMGAGMPLIALVAVALVVAIMSWSGLLHHVFGVRLQHLLVAGSLVVAFLLGCDAIAVFAGIAIDGPIARTHWVLLGSAYLASWLAGFVVPGAPGGLGVREGMLLFLLSDTTGAPFALSLAFATRVVTTAGDALFAVVGLIAQWRMR
jgi:hypothetical protein